MDYAVLMIKARETNARRDKIERAFGHAPLDMLPASELIRLAMVSIQAGVLTEDWDSVCEGQAMLELLQEETE